MTLDNVLLVHPTTLRDFDLGIPARAIDRQMIPLAQRAMTMRTVHFAAIDQNRLDDLASLQRHRFKDDGVFMQTVQDYFVDEVVQRLADSGEFDDVLPFQDEPGTKIETPNYIFLFKENERSIYAMHKRDPTQSTTLNSLVVVQKKDRRHALVVDINLGRNITKSFFTERRMRAANEFLASLGIEHSAISYMLCLPECTVAEALRYNQNRTKQQINKFVKLRRYILEKNQNLLVAFSGQAEDYVHLATQLRQRVERGVLDIGFPKRGSVHKAKHRIPSRETPAQDVAYWATKHAESGFPNSQLVFPVLSIGYQRISDVHDALTDLAKRDPELAEVRAPGTDFTFGEGDPHRVHKTNLALLHHARGYAERTMYAGFAHIYKMIGHILPEVQAKSLETLFALFPQPDTSSFDALVRSIYGPYVFPKKFIKGFRGYLAWRRFELSQEGIYSFDAGLFSQAATAFVKGITSHTRDTRQDFYGQAKRLPGSFESGTA